MTTHSRKLHKTRPSALPLDYAKMVTEVFKTNFDEGMKALAKLNQTKVHFTTTGSIYPEEVLVCVSLIEEAKLSAISAYASCDFDSKASAPTIQDLLSAGVDAIGSLFAQILDPQDPQALERLTHRSLSALENVPFEWTEMQVESVRTWVRVDRANPEIDQMADDWLEKNDPDHLARLAEEEREISELFVTGPKKTSADDSDDAG
jgi:hypothetical protein